MSLASVTAVVVAHDSAAVLPACLASLEAQGVATVVVDNASSDRSAEIARAAGARVVAEPRNEGFGRAMTIGMRVADTPFALLVNPDLTFEPGAVAELLAAAERYPDALILAPRIIEPDGRFFFAHRSLLSPYLRNEAGVKRLPEGDCCTPFLSGACWLVRRPAILDLGGFDPEIFLFYEDDDLCRRAVEAGGSLVHVHAAVARHARGASSGPAPGRIFKARFHLAWSRAYVCRKWGVADRPWTAVATAALKWVGAVLTRRAARVERYSGTVAGHLAFLRGERAVVREGLED